MKNKMTQDEISELRMFLATVLGLAILGSTGNMPLGMVTLMSTILLGIYIFNEKIR